MAAARVEPYVGGGIGVFNWRYSEIGDFVDTIDNSVFSQPATSPTGTSVGPVILAGIRFPFGDVLDVRRRSSVAEGRRATPTASTTGFLGDKIDLGG